MQNSSPQKTNRWALPIALLFSFTAIFLPGTSVEAKTPAAEKGQATVKPLSINEASGIAALPDGRFLIVDDEYGIILLETDGTPTYLLKAKKQKSMGELEGISLSSDKKSVYCLSERNGEVSRFPLKMSGKSVELGPIESLGQLPVIGEKANKGWEGICICLNGGRDQLVAVHQEKPRSVGLFELPSLTPIAIKELSSEMKQALDNLSDVAIDHRTGHLFLLSGKSQRVSEIDFLGNKDLTKFQVFNTRNLPLGTDERPEGLCFDKADQLVIVTDGSGLPGKILFFKQ